MHARARALPARVAPKDARNTCVLFDPAHDRRAPDRHARQQQRRPRAATAPGGPSTICSSRREGRQDRPVAERKLRRSVTRPDLQCGPDMSLLSASSARNSYVRSPEPQPDRPHAIIARMALDLAPADQEKLRDAFSEMTAPVRLLFFTQTLDCEPCAQTRQILDELPPLSDKIAIEEVNFVLDKDKATQYGVDRVPAIASLGRERKRRGDATTRESGFSATPVRLRVHLAGAGDPCWSAAPARSHRRQSPADRRRRQAGDDAGVHDPDVTALPAGGQPRARNGVRQPAHHRRTRWKHRVSGSRAALPRHRRAEDGRERGRSKFWAAAAGRVRLAGAREFQRPTSSVRMAQLFRAGPPRASQNTSPKPDHARTRSTRRA